MKDNISLAGVPTTNGSRVAPIRPSVDAVVVERILAAGGTIVGKLNMDDFGSSGLGETSAFGPARNPSIRRARPAARPAARRGGARGRGRPLARRRPGRQRPHPGRVLRRRRGEGDARPRPVLGDHAHRPHDRLRDADRANGRGAALLLEVIAGGDWRDAQWVRGPIRRPAATRRRATPASQGLRIGVVGRAPTRSICDAAVLDEPGRRRRRAARRGRRGGRGVDPALERRARDVPAVHRLLFADMFRSGGQGAGHLGAYDVDAMEAFAPAAARRAGRLPPQVKAWLVADRHVHERWAGVPYARLHNARLALRRDVTAALERWDLLLTPTLPLTAPKLLTGERVVRRDLRPHVGPTLLQHRAAEPDRPSGALGAERGRRGRAADGRAARRRAFRRAQAFRAAFALERALGPFAEPGCG